MIHRYIATVVEAKIQSPSDNIYNYITGGYGCLQGKLGEIWKGDRTGHFTYEFGLDITGGPSEEDIESYPNRGSMFRIPIVNYDEGNPKTSESLQVYCILFERVGSGAMEFARIGWMSVLYDWVKEIDQELWITDYARADTRGIEEVNIVTIV